MLLGISFLGVLKSIFMKFKVEKKIGLFEVLLVLFVLNGKLKILFVKIVEIVFMDDKIEVKFF